METTFAVPQINTWRGPESAQAFFIHEQQDNGQVSVAPVIVTSECPNMADNDLAAVLRRGGVNLNKYLQKGDFTKPLVFTKQTYMVGGLVHVLTAEVKVQTPQETLAMIWKDPSFQERREKLLANLSAGDPCTVGYAVTIGYVLP